MFIEVKPVKTDSAYTKGSLTSTDGNKIEVTTSGSAGSVKVSLAVISDRNTSTNELQTDLWTGLATVALGRNRAQLAHQVIAAELNKRTLVLGIDEIKTRVEEAAPA